MVAEVEVLSIALPWPQAAIQRDPVVVVLDSFPLPVQLVPRTRMN